MKDPAKVMSVNRLYRQPLTAPCHRAQPNAFSIDAEGNVYKCEHDIGRPDNKLGYIFTGVDDAVVVPLPNSPQYCLPHIQSEPSFFIRA